MTPDTIRTETIDRRVGTYAAWKAYDEEHGTSVAQTIFERHGSGGYSWHDECLQDTASLIKEGLEAIGVIDPKVYYSVGAHPGHGASFTGKLRPEGCLQGEAFDKVVAENMVPRKDIGGGAPIPMPEPPPQRICDVVDDLACQFKPVYGSREVHESSVYTDSDWSIFVDQEEHPNIFRVCEAWEERVEAWRMEVCYWIHNVLEAELEHLESEEYFAEGAESNEWEFNEDGEMI